jgi:hypothetical protein
VVFDEGVDGGCQCGEAAVNAAPDLAFCQWREEVLDGCSARRVACCLEFQNKSGRSSSRLKGLLCFVSPTSTKKNLSLFHHANGSSPANCTSESAALREQKNHLRDPGSFRDSSHQRRPILPVCSRFSA